MGKRLSDDEKRVFSDQITLLKNENERLTDLVEQLEAMLKQAAKDAYHSEVVQTQMLPLELEANPRIGADQYKEDWIETWLCALKESE